MTTTQFIKAKVQPLILAGRTFINLGNRSFQSFEVRWTGGERKFEVVDYKTKKEFTLFVAKDGSAMCFRQEAA